jgi:AcrR family transcriptional regulator
MKSKSRPASIRRKNPKTPEADKVEGEPRSARPRGRPSSDSVHRALVEAALEEFVERGYHAMSMESIAARAGVSKLSLYRRWNSKLAITAEVFRLLRETIPFEDHGSLESDIRSLIKQSIGSRDTKSTAKILLRTMGEISGNTELMALYREHILTPRMEQLRALLERAKARRELRSDLPIDVACAMIGGPLFLYYLALLAEAEVDLPSNLPSQLTRAILSGIAE